MRKNNYSQLTIKWITGIFLFLLMLGCKKSSDNTPVVDPNAIYPLKLSFQNKVGTTDLVLNDSYTNPHGEAMKISFFKYYISNIALIDESNVETKLADTYFLVDQQNAASRTLELKTKGNRFKAIKFLVGVDSIRNVSGVQTGALDPANGMFWTWDTGYIMAKLEGTSSGLSFGYDIIGFKDADATQRWVTMQLPTPVILKTSATSEVLLAADVNAWFKSANDIKIATTPFSLNPGPLAMKIADNYARMFTVAEVKNQ